MFDLKKFELLSEELKEDLKTYNVEYYEDLLIYDTDNNLLYDLLDELINNVFYKKYGSVEYYINKGLKIEEININKLVESINKAYTYYINSDDLKQCITNITIDVARYYNHWPIEYNFKDNEIISEDKTEYYAELMLDREINNIAYDLSFMINEIIESELNEQYNDEQTIDNINNDYTFIYEFIRDNDQLSSKDLKELKRSGLI